MESWQAVVEHVYRSSGDDRSWLDDIATALSDHSPFEAWWVFTYRIGPGSSVAVDRVVDRVSAGGHARAGSASALDRSSRVEAMVRVMALLQDPVGRRRGSGPDFGATGVATLSEMARYSLAEVATLQQAFWAEGVADCLLATGIDTGLRGFGLLGLSKDELTLAEDERTLWWQLAIHGATAYRLRRRIRDLETIAQRSISEASAETPAEAGDAVALQALRAAVVGRREPRATSREIEGERALEMWTELVATRESLVDYFVADGKSYILMHPYPPQLSSLVPLSPREALVVSHARSGHSNKEIAWELGLSPQSVGTFLSRAYRKLNVRNRVELIRLLSIGDTPTGEL